MTELKNIKEKTITSLELVEQINLFREQEYKDKENFGNLTEVEKKRGHYVELPHYDLLKIIRDEFEEEINDGKISSVDYKDNKGELRPMFVLSLDQAKQLLMRESKFVRKAIIKYINKLEKEDAELKLALELKDRLLLCIMLAENDTDRAIAINNYQTQYVRPLENNLKAIIEKLEYKQNVINCISDELKIKSQRQFLNEIIKMKGVEFIKDRWNLLYKEHELHKHINLKARIESYNIVNKPKVKSKLQYIDEVLKDITTLYRLAVKIFESDFKDKLQKYIEVL